MIRNVEDWTIEELHKHRTSISFPEYQRQPHLWSTRAKALLIDSILKGIDIPKLYFSVVGEDEYEVIDGQQRLWAIWDFLDNQYECTVGTSSKLFSALDKARQDKIRNYTLQVVMLERADDAYLRDLFLRLQLGLLLNAGEKLHAKTGVMKDFVFDKLPAKRFVRALGIPKRRYAKETLCAQICINSFYRAKVGTFARTRFEDLEAFFDEYSNPQGSDEVFFRERERSVLDTIEKLGNCFGDRAADLKNRSYILSAYLMFEELDAREQLRTKGAQDKFVTFIIALWKRVRDEARAGFDRRNRNLYEFDVLVNSAPGERYQIERRHEKLFEYFDYFQAKGKIKGD